MSTCWLYRDIKIFRGLQMKFVLSADIDSLLESIRLAQGFYSNLVWMLNKYYNEHQLLFCFAKEQISLLMNTQPNFLKERCKKSRHKLVKWILIGKDLLPPFVGFHYIYITRSNLDTYVLIIDKKLSFTETVKFLS